MTDLRHPAATSADISAVLDAVLALPELADNAPLPRASGLLADAMRGWDRLDAQGRVAELPPLAVTHLGELAELSAEVERLADRGGALCHLDLLAANVLIDEADRVTFTGWQFASRGWRVFDAASYLFEQAGAAPLPLLEGLLSTHPVFDGAQPDDIDAILAGVTGWSLAGGHEDWGGAGLAWIAARRGWSEDGEAD